jgi:NADPH-dependent 7-cyano-7-deazaguanine reductase QueF-like protein
MKLYINAYTDRHDASINRQPTEITINLSEAIRSAIKKELEYRKEKKVRK